MLSVLNDFDTSLFLALNGVHNHYFDNFMYAFSGKFIWIPFYLAVIYQVVKLAGKQSVWIILGLILMVTLADQISSSLIKDLVQRLRPSQNENLKNLVHIVNDYRGGKYGFVSSHAANAFGFAVMTSLLFRNKIYTFSAVIWALITGYSRIYLGVHYPGDVFGGIIVGTLSALFCYFLLRKYKCENAQLKITGLNIPVIVLALNVLGIVLYSFI